MPAHPCGTVSAHPSDAVSVHPSGTVSAQSLMVPNMDFGSASNIANYKLQLQLAYL